MTWETSRSGIGGSVSLEGTEGVFAALHLVPLAIGRFAFHILYKVEGQLHDPTLPEKTYGLASQRIGGQFEA